MPYNPSVSDEITFTILPNPALLNTSISNFRIVSRDGDNSITFAGSLLDYFNNGLSGMNIWIFGKLEGQSYIQWMPTTTDGNGNFEVGVPISGMPSGTFYVQARFAGV